MWGSVPRDGRLLYFQENVKELNITGFILYFEIITPLGEYDYSNGLLEVGQSLSA